MRSYITTEYYWHWDLEAAGLNVWEYREMMEKLMKTVDMVWFATDDPEICAHPANCLMVAHRQRVPLSSWNNSTACGSGSDSCTDRQPYEA